MSNYQIYTDSACDIKPALLAEWGVRYRELTFRFDDSEQEYSNNEMDTPAFYQKMRDGGVAKTAAINTEGFVSAFEESLKAGVDVLYIGFSSGLSTTYNSGRLAALQLAEKYPDRKITVIDTLAASAGEGLLVYLAVEKQKEGASLEDNAAYIESIKLNLCHWFTVDDLVYLKRGGRVSPTAAFFGNMLGIKPVMHVDNEGHLIPVSKIRGRKMSLREMADHYTESAIDPTQGPVFISHGDCIKDAEELAAILKSRHNVDVELITDVGPVIGAHSGPGTLALFFLGNVR